MGMRYGLMDIGSNTIHAVIYELDGAKWKKVLSEKEYAEIISYVEDQRLSADRNRATGSGGGKSAASFYSIAL